MTKPSDRDIDATALLLIRKHGEDAWLVARQRADELIGDPDGLAAWKRIIAAVDRLQADPPAGPAMAFNNAHETLAWIAARKAAGEPYSAESEARAHASIAEYEAMHRDDRPTKRDLEIGKLIRSWIGWAND